MTGTELAITALMLVGLVGVVVPLLPGTLLIAAGVVVWIVDDGLGQVGPLVSVLLLVVGAVAKYAVPGRRLRVQGIPARTMAAGGVGAVAGFLLASPAAAVGGFLLPPLALVSGFVLGVYVAEGLRLGWPAAWPAARHALVAAGISFLIELTAAVSVVTVWFLALAWDRLPWS